MANKQIEMRKIKRLYQLYTEGVSQRKISVQLGISRNSISKYLACFNRYELSYDEVSRMTVKELTDLLNNTIPPKSDQLKTLEQYFPYFDKELRKTGVTRRLLWEEYKEKHPDGYKLTQFCHYYKEWSVALSPVMHLNHKAGDKLFVDYTGKTLQVVDEHTGSIQDMEVFVSILGSSQMTYVQASPSQKKEDFIHCMEQALHFYGGVPQAIVTDNLKSAVLKSSRYEPKLNETFADFAAFYETTILPTRAYRPRDKAIVENAVRIIYTRVFARLRKETFHTLESLNVRILELLKQHNDMSFRGRSYSRKILFDQSEKALLKALPESKYELKHYTGATVQKISHVYLNKDKHYYSVPYKYIGKKVRIIYSRAEVEIYYKQSCIAVHSRDQRSYCYTTEKDHMPSQHQFVSDWSSEKFLDWAKSIGPECEEYIKKILDKRQHPEQSYKSCVGILQFSKKIENKRLNDACKRALTFQAYSYQMIKNIIEKGWDKITEEVQQDIELPKHKNIRGGHYYK